MNSEADSCWKILRRRQRGRYSRRLRVPPHCEPEAGVDVIIHMGSLVPAAAISEASAWLSQHESECLQTDGRSWDQVVAHAVDLLRQPAREGEIYNFVFIHYL